MDGELTYREAMPEEERARVLDLLESSELGKFCSRAQAAHVLKVVDRTVDRYIRRGRLTAYVGRLPNGGRGVLIWAADVNLMTKLTPKVRW